jgi:hypothetical protein
MLDFRNEGMRKRSSKTPTSPQPSGTNKTEDYRLKAVRLAGEVKQLMVVCFAFQTANPLFRSP